MPKNNDKGAEAPKNLSEKGLSDEITKRILEQGFSSPHFMITDLNGNKFEMGVNIGPQSSIKLSEEDIAKFKEQDKQIDDKTKDSFPYLHNLLDGVTGNSFSEAYNVDLEQLQNLAKSSRFDAQDLDTVLSAQGFKTPQEARQELEGYVTKAGGDINHKEVKSELDKYEQQMGNLFELRDAYEKLESAQDKVKEENVGVEPKFGAALAEAFKRAYGYPIEEGGLYGPSKEVSEEMQKPLKFEEEKSDKKPEAKKDDKTSQVPDELKDSIAKFEAAKGAGIEGASGQVPNHNVPSGNETYLG